MVKVREDWVDWAKTILIFLMVLGHNHITGMERLWIYGFHMPAFFIISGYLYKPRDWRKTLKGFVVPIVFYSIIRFCFYLGKQYLQGHPFPENVLYRTLVPFVKSNVNDEITLFSGIWFLVCLLICRLICGDISIRTNRSFVFVLSIICLLFMTVESCINVSPLIQETFLYRTIACLPFFTLGMLWKEYKPKMPKSNMYCSVIILGIYSVVSMINGYVEFAGGIYGLNYFITFINAVLGAYCLFSICRYFKTSKIVQVFSVGTILILGLHKIIINLLSMTFLFELLNIVTLKSILYTILVMIFCYLPIKICLKKLPILLGK